MFKIIFLFFVFILIVEEIWDHAQYFSMITKHELDQAETRFVEDLLLDSGKLIEKNGYPIEVHEVETEDGYLLTMYRIFDKKKDHGLKRSHPVLLVHGLECSSAVFIINGPKKSLSYILADEGYDVWLANTRGNRYSKKHKNLSSEQSTFWNFDINEVGVYDLPAIIDYILEETSYKKMHLIGHSQGCTAFFIMASERPEYNEKIVALHALGPVVFMSNTESPLLKYTAPFASFYNMLTYFGSGAFLPFSEMTIKIAHTVCHEDSKFVQLCLQYVFLLCGYDQEQLNNTMLPVYLSHAPSGAAARQLIHYIQWYNSGKFRKYDYGSVVANLYTYGTMRPPDYDLSLVTSQVILYYGDNDWLVHPKDLDKLRKRLKNVSYEYRVPYKHFNHLDFLYAINASDLLYYKIIDYLKITEANL